MEQQGMSGLSKVVIALVVLGFIGGAWVLLTNNSGGPGGKPASSQPAGAGNPAQPPAPPPQPPPNPPAAGRVSLGIAYGTEKQRWLEWARDEFAKTPAGRQIDIQLIPMGSIEAARAIVNGKETDDARTQIHVWSPASSVYRNSFINEWQLKRGTSESPIAKEEQLALSPMVMVMWKERYDAFVKKYGELSLQNIAKARQEPGGWRAIANQPDWGEFKFSHTHPDHSNSGLVALVLMAYAFHNKTAGLTKADLTDIEFQKWLPQLEPAATNMIDSTGTLMKQMVVRGPSTYDVIFVYESVAIDYLKNAEGRWGELQVSYPKFNMWNDNPYCILNVPWCTPRHRQAAETFLKFLMSEPIQAKALEHGFRPGNPAVAVKFPESPLVKLAPNGLKVDLTGICEPPSAEVLFELQSYWQKAVGSR